jgi:hypothetical protein
MTTLLRYDITANEFPLQASQASGNLNVTTITVVGSNPNPSAPVTLQGLIITLPVGANSSDLAPDATGIGPVPPAGWTLQATQPSSGQVKYIFYPESGQGVVKGDGLNFIFNNVQINRETGTVQVDVMEGSNNCTPPACPVQSLYITKFPSGWGEVSYWSVPVPPIVQPGGGLALHWAGPLGATYMLAFFTPQTGLVQVPGPGQPPLANQGQYPGASDPPLQLYQDTTFYLSVAETINNQTYTAQEQITATVETPPELAIELFECSTNAFGVGDVITLSWKTELAQSCTLEISQGSGVVNVSAVNDVINSCNVTCPDAVTLIFTKTDGSNAELGRLSLSSTAVTQTTFILSASGQSGVTQKSFQINLLPAQINTFSVSARSEMAMGQSEKLSGTGTREHSDQSGAIVLVDINWQTTHATNISINPYGGGLQPSGFSEVGGSFGQTFTLNCLGFGGPQSASSTA